MCSCSQSPVFCKVFYVLILQSLYHIFSDFSFFFSVGQGGAGWGGRGRSNGGDSYLIFVVGC